MVLLFWTVSCKHPAKKPVLEVNEHVLSVPCIDSSSTFNALAQSGADYLEGQKIVKFLIDVRNKEHLQVLWLNANFKGECVRSPNCQIYHYNAAREIWSYQDSSRTFNRVTYYTQDKSFYAGSVHAYHTEKTGDFYGVHLYPQDIAQDIGIESMMLILRDSLLEGQAKMAFVETGNQQHSSTLETLLQQHQIKLFNVRDLIGDRDFLPMNQGSAYGYLRIFPARLEDLNDKDIPVFESLPLDIPAVAGSITKDYQDLLSHVQLKAQERQTPNMVLRSASKTHELLSSLDNKPVHLVVKPDKFILELSDDETVLLHAEQKNNKPWVQMPYQASSIVQALDSMCVSNLSKCLHQHAVYGGKSAQLGFLKELFKDKQIPIADTLLAYDPVPTGVAVPLTAYVQFVAQQKAVENAVLALVMQDKNKALTRAEVAAHAKAIQQAILDAPVTQADTDALQGYLKEVRKKLQMLTPQVNKFKVRSSANAEDIESFNAAGLHDSFSTKLDEKEPTDHHCVVVPDPEDGGDLKVKPKSLSCAVKAVYASLFNERAILERRYAHVDQSTAFMGLLIVPVYDTESEVIANGVLLTRVSQTQDVYGYTLSLMPSNILVTNPPAGTRSEQTLAIFGDPFQYPSMSTLFFAKPTIDGAMMSEPVLPLGDNQMLSLLALKIEQAYCFADGTSGDCNYIEFNTHKPYALDIEFKFLKNRQFVIKQVRTHH